MLNLVEEILMSYLFSILSMPVLQQDDTGIFALLTSGFVSFCGLIFAILIIAGMWRMFVKAGKPGWAAIIPIYNIFVLLQIVGRPGWWLILFFIPVVNVVVALLVSIDLAKSFDKSAAWGIIMLFIFNAIGYLILGFGDARYKGPVAAS
jgi:hypothetical protein